jgi:hypothetical protein
MLLSMNAWKKLKPLSFAVAVAGGVAAAAAVAIS